MDSGAGSRETYGPTGRLDVFSQVEWLDAWVFQISTAFLGDLGTFLWWLEDQVFWTMDESYNRAPTSYDHPHGHPCEHEWISNLPCCCLQGRVRCSCCWLFGDFGWLWMPLFCPMIGLRINNRGHVRCHTGVLHLRVPTQPDWTIHNQGCVLSVQIGKALSRFLSFRPSFCWIMVRFHGHGSVERISKKLAICLV